MKRIIVDYSKLTNEILNLLVEKFPDGYDDSDVISFKNAKGELVEAVEVRTEDTIYLVKVSTKLASRIENYEIDEEDLDDVVIPEVPLEKIKGAGVDLDDEDDEEEEKEDKPDVDEDDEDEDGEKKSSRKSKDEDEDEDDED